MLSPKEAERELKNLKNPTNNHQEYIEYMISICNKNFLSLILEGSLAHNVAKSFSDIDLILCGNINSELFDSIVEKYNHIVMTNLTENPKGILILNYENGISVDLDIRETVLQSELDNEMILCDYGFDISNTKERKVIQSKWLPVRPDWYKTIRLIHRCCIKYLCGKQNAAEALAMEVDEAMIRCCEKITLTGGIKERMQYSLWELNRKYDVDEDIMKIFIDLFEHM